MECVISSKWGDDEGDVVGQGRLVGKLDFHSQSKYTRKLKNVLGLAVHALLPLGCQINNMGKHK